MRTVDPFTHFEHVCLQEANLRDSEDRVIENCTFLRQGFTRCGRRLYPVETLREAVPLFESRVLNGHGTLQERKRQAERDNADWIGVSFNPRFENGKVPSVRGDIKLFGENHPNANMVWEMLQEPSARKLSGLSWEGQAGQKPIMVRERRVACVAPIHAVHGLAFVQEPNAASTFESREVAETMAEMIESLDDLRAMDPKVAERIERQVLEAHQSKDEGGLEKLADTIEAKVSTLFAGLKKDLEQTAEVGRRKAAFQTLVAESDLPQPMHEVAEMMIDWQAEDFEAEVRDKITKTQDKLNAIAEGGKPEGEGSKPDKKGTPQDSTTAVVELGEALAGAFDLPVRKNGGGDQE
jgi:hypothetical protein